MLGMAEPRELVDVIEREPSLPAGRDERFAGYGVMGLPFASGHILAMRRFPASSLGQAYTSVWHRDPDGRWTFYQDVQPDQACPRFFGSALAAAHVSDIDLTWTGPRSFDIRIDGGDTMAWGVSLAPTAATRAMNAMAGLMPGPLWRSATVLRMMAGVAGVALGAGKLGMTGHAPNGQSFIANPLRIWSIPSSTSTVRGEDLGPLGPVPVQARLGDFWIPQTGLFAIGRAFFEPYDATRHLGAVPAGASAEPPPAG
jgi:hypothetical protein